jgi:hypothetical protein
MTLQTLVFLVDTDVSKEHVASIFMLHSVRWREHIPSKLRYPSTRQHNVTIRKLTTVETSKLMYVSSQKSMSEQSLIEAVLCSTKVTKGREFRHGKRKSGEASAGFQVALIFIGYIMHICCSI